MNDAALARVRALARRGERHWSKGEHARAAACFEKAAAMLERRRRPHPLAVVALLNRAASCRRQLGAFVEAGQLLQRANAILLDRGLEQTSAAADTFSQYAALEHAAGNWLRGEPFARRAYVVRARLYGRQDPRVAPDLINLAALVERLGQLSVAERMCRQALRLLSKTPNGGGQAAAVAHSNLGAIAFASGNMRQAREHYRRTQQIELTLFGRKHGASGFTDHNLAVLSLALGRRKEARLLFARALSSFERHFGAAHPSVVRCLESYANVLRRSGEDVAARRLAVRAARGRGAIDAVNPEGVAATGTINLQRACYRLSVRPSAIHRIGVFADEPIPKGRKVIEYTGERISQREAERRWNPTHSYLFDLNDRSQLDGAIGGSGAEYINHSCTPNLRSRILRDHILYFSDRAILPGEELTIDYHYEADLDPIPCSCGTPECRGTMNVLPPKPSRKKP